MRFASVIIPFLYASLAVAGTSLSSPQNPIKDKKPAVPGNNPVVFCGNTTDYILTVDHIDLTPNPPVPGETLSVSANGTFAKDVEAGAKVFLQVKYGLITLIKQEADLCDQIGNVDLSCPLKKGALTLSKDVKIPKEVPKGKYTVSANVTSIDDEIITCMESVVYF